MPLGRCRPLLPLGLTYTLFPRIVKATVLGPLSHLGEGKEPRSGFWKNAQPYCLLFSFEKVFPKRWGFPWPERTEGEEASLVERCCPQVVVSGTTTELSDALAGLLAPKPLSSF